MGIEEEFNSIADGYDANRRKFIPCFDAFYKETTAFIASSITPPSRVADLGAGTGLLSQYWMEHFPNASYTLVDAASSMLDVARERFGKGRHDKTQIEYVVSNYADNFSLLGYDAVISALSLHHLDDEGKSHLFKRIYDALPHGGVFVNYDQFCADSTKVNDWVTSYWENKVLHSTLTAEDISSWRKRQKLDRECSVARELDMLRYMPSSQACSAKGALFGTAECVFMSLKFAVILAVKEP